MQYTINFTLVQQLRVFGLDAFQFDRDFFPRGHVGTQINITK